MGDGTLSDALRRRAHTLRTRASEPSGIKLVDKLLFCAGFTFIPLTEWVMIVHPHRFSYWYRPHALCSPTLRRASAIGSSGTPKRAPAPPSRPTAALLRRGRAALAGTRRRSCCC